MSEFERVGRLPPYVFSIVNRLKAQARADGNDVIDFGMGNPDRSTPQHIVSKLIEVVSKEGTHRYSSSRGVLRLRRAICEWYRRRFDVELDPEEQAIVTIGSKEGIAHLMLAVLKAGDCVLVPSPTYPIHPYSCVIAGADVLYVPLIEECDFFESVQQLVQDAWPRPRLLVLNFPGNPTTRCVELSFFEKIIDFAREHQMWVVHDIAYAEIVFDGYRAPSILQVPGADELAVEFYSLSKTYNMPGWRVGFMCGCRKLVAALEKIKSYLDYGLFTPIQVAAITALEGSQDCVEEVRETYCKRRDFLCDGLNELGWHLEKPRATMFAWAPIPELYRNEGSLEFSKRLLNRAQVAVSPGIGFGSHGDTHVRFSLIENEQRIRQALRNMKRMFKEDHG